MFELLEMRRLLSATLVDGVLTVTGTRKDDLIRIVQKPTTLLVTVNGHLDAFKPTHVRSVIVNGNRGNDRILLSVGSIVYLGDATTTPQLDLKKKLRVDGGGGNDAIDSGGGAHTTLLGGDGNDFLQASSYQVDNQIIGGTGDDTMLGGAGSEDMSGGDGNDTVQLYGFSNFISLDDIANDGYRGINFDTASYSANDVIFNPAEFGDSEGDNIHSDIETVIGNTGNDSITGSGADNLLIGGGGNDTLEGGGGNDTLNGGAGLDLLVGGSGRDQLIGDTDADMIYGGAGSDLAVDPDLHDGFPADDVERAVATGTVDRYASIGDSFGGGNTGWILHLPAPPIINGDAVAVPVRFTDIDVTGQVGKTKALIGQKATAVGKLEIRNFIERGLTPVIVVESIKAS
jgi:Ca2+-binding RTX toxin-like protein